MSLRKLLLNPVPKPNKQQTFEIFCRKCPPETQVGDVFGMYKHYCKECSLQEYNYRSWESKVKDAIADAVDRSIRRGCAGRTISELVRLAARCPNTFGEVE